ncbi:MAG: hypothetical protein HYW48_03860 [Deltaproteobacteria bacterium]|nr:hypothetical protein [Deltaproteobacteria bacterium]
MRRPKLTSGIFLITGCLALFACAGEEKEVEEAVETQSTEQAAVEPGEEGGLDQMLNEDAGEQLDLQQEQEAPAVAPARPYNPAERVVRFVLADQTSAYQRADMMSPSVAKYRKGDPLVVKLEGDWAQLTDDYFIRSSALSQKVVPRSPNTNDWLIQSLTRISSTQ